MNIEQIEKLKESWKKDPCWDIEATEGFEDHVEELLSFRRQTEAEQQTKAECKAQTRQKNFANSTGIDDYDLAQTLKTFEEIGNELDRAVNWQVEIERVQIEAAQVRATLLLAAEVKRIADTLQDQEYRRCRSIE
jgi:hypothetical protein